MEMPKAINQAEIDEIIAEYDRMIAENPANEAIYRMMRDTKVAETIGRQRQDAIKAGGELGERIKAENEALMRQFEAENPDYSAKLAEAKKRQAEFEAYKKSASEQITMPKFCTYCGSKLTENSKFCANCGAEISTMQ